MHAASLSHEGAVAMGQPRLGGVPTRSDGRPTAATGLPASLSILLPPRPPVRFSSPPLPFPPEKRRGRQSKKRARRKGGAAPLSQLGACMSQSSGSAHLLPAASCLGGLEHLGPVGVGARAFVKVREEDVAALAHHQRTACVCACVCVCVVFQGRACACLLACFAMESIPIPSIDRSPDRCIVSHPHPAAR